MPTETVFNISAIITGAPSLECETHGSSAWLRLKDSRAYSADIAFHFNPKYAARVARAVAAFQTIMQEDEQHDVLPQAAE